MKVLIFVGLKIVELIGVILFLAILALIFEQGYFAVKIIGMTVFGLVILAFLIFVVLPTNLDWTNKIYDKYFKKEN